MEINRLMTYAFAALLTLGTAACGSDNENDSNGNGSEYSYGQDGGVTSCNYVLFNEEGEGTEKGKVIGNGEKELVFKGTQTLKKGTYILKGWVYIADGSTLTIEPGTIIKGDKETMASIIVERGGKLIAQGTKAEPIIFTSNQAKGSRKPGDWGGIIFCGKAPNNQNNDMMIEGGPRSHHGGIDAADNSGILSYVRIEFAGYPFEVGEEINGLTLASVGSRTQIDHVQISYSNDDSYEWFGGTVNCKYLVAYKGWDDDFDTDNGFCGKVQFGLSVRDPRIADSSQSNGFESDNCGDGANVEPYTTVTFSNMTFIGPRVQTDFVNVKDSYINGGGYNPNNGSTLGMFQSAMQIRRSSRLNCFNSVAIGFPVGLIIDGQKGNTVTAASEGKFKLQNIWFAEMGATGSDGNKHHTDNLYDPITETVLDANKESNSSSFFKAESTNKITEIAYLQLQDNLSVGVNYKPQAGSPLIGPATFTDAAVSTGFDKVNYIGAFDATSNWMEGWTNFDPNNADY